jgi:6-phosphogluconolactonase (cycloisomerase 2 family)
VNTHVSRPRTPAGALTLAAVVVLFVIVPTAAATRGLGLVQIAGGQGCIAQPDEESTALKGCGRGRGLIDANDIALSADGKSLYVAAAGASAVSAFARDGATGRLAQVNCVTANGTAGVDGTEHDCADGDALGGTAAVAVSADGRFVYAASYTSGGIAIFSRNPDTGAVRQIGCVRPVKTCVSARGLSGAAALALSPDGLNLYVASADADAVSMFKRDAATGLLTPIGCISDDGSDRLCGNGNTMRGASAIVASGDGKNVYVAAGGSNAVLTFARDTATGALTQKGCVMEEAPRKGSCVRGRAVSGIVSLALTADGRTLFGAASDSSALAVFARDPVTGTIREVGCVSETPFEGDESPPDGCAHTTPFSYPTGVAVTRDGARVYVSVSSGLQAFDRDRTTGTLSPAGCLVYEGYFEDLGDDEETGGPKCSSAHGIAEASDVAVTSDGRNVYVTSWNSDAITTFAAGVSLGTPALMRGAASVGIRVSCPALHTDACAGRLTLSASPRNSAAATTRYRVESGASGVIHLRLTKPLAKALVKQRALAATLAASDETRAAAPVKRRVVLHARQAGGRNPKR